MIRKLKDQNKRTGLKEQTVQAVKTNQKKQRSQKEEENPNKEESQKKETNQDIYLDDLEQRIMKSREVYMETKIPEGGLRKMKEAMERAKTEKKRSQRRARRKMFVTGMAASFALVCLVPNCSRASAQILMKLPLVGRFFEVITVRDYQFDDGYSSANVKIPKVSEILDSSADEEDAVIEDINQSVEAYTKEILERFEENQKILKSQGHQSLDISYKTLTNTANWFTLELTVTEVQASGFEYRQYYHIDKSTGEIASITNLFLEDSNYQQIINTYIQEQMKEYNKNNPDGEVYWIGESEFESGFQGIDEEQGFYLDTDGSLVIVFDEYEVAPGYMGMPEFKIPQELIRDIRRF